MKHTIEAKWPTKNFAYLVNGFFDTRNNSGVEKKAIYDNYFHYLNQASAANQIKRWQKHPEKVAAERIATIKKAVLIAQEVDSRFVVYLYYRLAELSAMLGLNRAAIDYCERALAYQMKIYSVTEKNIKHLLRTLKPPKMSCSEKPNN